MKNYEKFYERMGKISDSLKKEEKMCSKLWEILNGCDTDKFFILMNKVIESKTNKEYYRNFDTVCSVNDKYREAAYLLTYFDLKAMHICDLQDKFKSGEGIEWVKGCDYVTHYKLSKDHKIEIRITFEDFVTYVLNYKDWEAK